MRSRSWLLWLALICGLALFLLVTFQSTSTRGVAVGEVVGDLGLNSFQGNGAPVDLSDWRGQGLILRFSSTNCATCPQDFSLLSDWQRALGERVRVIAVQVGDTAGDVSAALMGQEPEVPILLDEDGTAARRLGLRSVPAVYFITARGTLSSVSNTELARTDVAGHARLMLAGGPDIEQEVRTVARGLQCQECQGRSAWESDSASSFEMRDRARQMLIEGLRSDEVLEAFAEEYGEWILIAPRARGFASLAWALPIGALVVGVGVWVRLLRRAGRRRPVEPESRDDEAFAKSKERLAKRIDDYM